MEVYTVTPTPWALGGTTAKIKTIIEEYERISIGKGYYGILFKNPIKNLWHLALENCGALIGTHKSRAILIKGVKKDVEDGDEEIVAAQIKQGISELNGAKLMDRDLWFEMFKAES